MATSREKRLEKVSDFISTLEKKKIKLLAVDFDQTLISIHSGGVWKDSVDNLAKHLRPCMRDLLNMALQKDLIVGIVTFHQQPWLIREMLKNLYKRDAERIIVQANTIEFREKHNYEFLGKEAHIAAVLTEVYNRSKLIIKPDEVILLDDDTENVQIAVEFGHWAFRVEETISYDNFEEFASILHSAEKPIPKGSKTNKRL